VTEFLKITTIELPQHANAMLQPATTATVASQAHAH
jgi:hypothetical protein